MLVDRHARGESDGTGDADVHGGDEAAGVHRYRRKTRTSGPAHLISEPFELPKYHHRQCDQAWDFGGPGAGPPPPHHANLLVSIMHISFCVTRAYVCMHLSLERGGGNNKQNQQKRTPFLLPVLLLLLTPPSSSSFRHETGWRRGAGRQRGSTSASRSSPTLRCCSLTSPPPASTLSPLTRLCSTLPSLHARTSAPSAPPSTPPRRAPLPSSTASCSWSAATWCTLVPAASPPSTTFSVCALLHCLNLFAFVPECFFVYICGLSFP